MKKLGLYLFLALFLLMALTPAVGMLVYGPSQAAANEILAQPPAVTEKDGSFNRAVLNDASDYLRDRFWLRQELITVNAALEAAIFRESASQDVILGKSGWLYFADTLDDFQGENQLTERQLWAAAHSLALIREYAAETGAATLFVPVPNKNTIYPEYMPASALPASEPGNLDRLLSALQAEGVDAVDLRPALLSAKADAQLYQTLDSHWNNLGAALAHDVIAEALGKPGRAYDPTRFTSRRDHSPDLYEMLYPAGTEKDLQYYPVWEQSFEYSRPIRSPEDQRINTSSDTGSGSLLMFRDSFGNTLHSFMAEDYEAACFSRAMPYDLRMMETEQPDTLILEITERHLRWLAERAPILPAPVRSLDPGNAVQTTPVTLHASQEEEGWFCLSGELPLPSDPDSPVYLSADGIIYEATPVGETEWSFTAYLPEAPAETEFFFYEGGVLRCSPADVLIP